MTKFLNISTDNTLGGNSPSDSTVVSQKAIKEYVDTHGGSVSIDNSTITENASQEIQAVATVNQNTASGATNPVYDWVGTLAEYQAQNIETLHPDWICYIIDDVSGGPSVYTKNEVDTIASGKANIALDNITSAGKAVCARMSMPSGAYTNLTLGASGSTYTAPADGYVTLIKAATSVQQYIELSIGQVFANMAAVYNGQLLYGTIPVFKGAVFQVNYNAGGAINRFVFSYAYGAQ